MSERGGFIAAVEAGRAARRQGLPLSANPYPEIRSERGGGTYSAAWRNAWQRGWESEMAGMMALSLWQPWATLIALGIKVYETRHWSTRYRGPLAIHAAKRPLDADGRWLVEQTPELRGLVLPVGGVVAVAHLAAIHRTEDVPADIYGNFEPGRFAWELRDVRPVEPLLPMAGRQMLWEVGPATAKGLLDRMGGSR